MTIDLRGKRLSPEQLDTLLPQKSIFGIKAPNKIAFSVLSLMTIDVLGMVAGLLGGKIFTDIGFDYERSRYFSVGFFTIILISVYTVIRRGILAAWFQSIGAGSLFMLMLSLLLWRADLLPYPVENTLGRILLNVIFSGFSIVNTVAFAVTVQILRQALPKQYTILQGVLIGLMGAIATDTAVKLSQASLLLPGEVKNLPPGSVQWSVLGALAWTIVVVLGGLCLSEMMGRSHPRFLWLKQACTAIASLGGTSFYNLDLSSISFYDCNIANSDFRGKILYRTCLKGIKGLDYARVDNCYLDLDQPKVQKLLTDNQKIPIEKDFYRVNLQGAFLQEANLQEVNFTQANLHGANLRQANLREAWLVHTRVTGVDFSGADLTGCYIKDWSINRETNFTGVICNYIYYLEFEQGELIKKSRYPRDRDFEPGEFAALQHQVENSVELVFPGATNLRVLDLTLEQFKLEDNGIGLQLQGIEQRGDIYVVKVSYLDGISPQQVTETVYNTFNFFKGESGTAYNVVQPIGDNMQNKNINNSGGNLDASSGAKVSINGDVTGSTLNLGTISGNVSNLIQQLRDSPMQGSQNLAQILGELHSTIQSEAQLSDSQKQDALEAVETLAEEAKKPSENRAAKLCTMAMNALKGVTSTLSDASKLAEVIKNVLPVLQGLLG